MRKTQLENEYNELKKQLDYAQSTIIQLNNKIFDLEEFIEQSKLQNKEISVTNDLNEINYETQAVSDEKAKALNNNTSEQKELKEITYQPIKSRDTERITILEKDVEYGASVIGKTVIEAAKYCNIITGGSAPVNAKELVNLILGRTEVAKSEILGIVISDLKLDEKKSEIDLKFDNAVDYFKSIIAQTN